MADIALKVQNVNGDPATTGGNIIIVTGAPVDVIFNEIDSPPDLTVEPGETLTIGGVVYKYEYLGSGDVRGDSDQAAGFIRITGSDDPGAPLPVGTTYAIDLTGDPPDPDYPNLQNGNTKLEVSDLDLGQKPFVCFCRGTNIQTPDGPVRIEDLSVGDLVTTMDHGPKPILWLGHRKLWVDRSMAPIVFRAGVLGNADALTVSPSHRILVSGWRAEVLFGQDEVLVAAKHFLNMGGVFQMAPGIVDYFHVLLGGHEIIFAEGQAAESLHCHQDNIALFDPEGRDEILKVFPELRDRLTVGPSMSRVCLRGYEAEALFSQS